MITKALLARLKAKPGKEKEVEEFLKGALPVVVGEPATINWYVVKFSNTTFGIFDTFPDEGGRQAHLAGEVVKALTAYAPELLAEEPDIFSLDILAFK